MTTIAELGEDANENVTAAAADTCDEVAKKFADLEIATIEQTLSSQYRHEAAEAKAKQDAEEKAKAEAEHQAAYERAIAEWKQRGLFKYVRLQFDRLYYCAC